MDAPLAALLENARERGFLGPGPVAPQLAHAEAFATLLDEAAGPFLDLGSGGGLPGLVLALRWPAVSGVLLDSHARRTAFLGEAIQTLGIADRVRVVHARAEDAARAPDLRGAFELATARSFGPPAVTAECAVAFLQAGGRLAVSEPPDADPTTRWPEDALTELGLTPPETRRGGGATLALMTLPSPASDRWPRRTGIPAKRPLWT